MPLPQDDSAIYYLRNSCTHHYLFTINTDVATDANRVDDAIHQWRLIKTKGKPAVANYKLQNVGNNQYVNISTKINSYGGSYTAVTSTVAADVCISENGYGIFVMSIVDSSNSPYILSDAGGSCYALTPAYWASQSQASRNEWFFDIISGGFPLLPKAIYRIRSFNTSYLLTMPHTVKGEVGNPYVSHQDPNNDFQKWFLIPQPDGYYTICNPATGGFLAASAANAVKGTRLICQFETLNDPPFQWNIQSFVPGIMFSIGLSDAELSIGFPNYIVEDLSEVTLQPSDNIPSQIWFFEKFEPLAPATFHATRQLEPGTYTLESCHTKQYLSVSPDDYVIATSDQTQATKFTVHFTADHSPKFDLSYSDPDYGAFYLSVEKNRIVTSDEKGKANWVLLPRKLETGIVYHICDSTPTHPRRVISSRKIKDRKRSYFALDSLAEGEPVQLWKFHSQIRKSPLPIAVKDGRP